MSTFHFKRFSIEQAQTTLRVNTDGVLLGAWAALPESGRVLDIGTGTGAIALMAAQRAPQAEIIGVESEAAAAEQARQNAARSPFADRVRILTGAIQEIPTECAGQCAAIVSNPPFFEANAHLAAQNPAKNLAKHSHQLPFEELLAAVDRLLLPDGRFFCIVPAQAVGRFEQLGRAHNLFLTNGLQVSSIEGKPAYRALLGFGRKPSEPHWGELAILDRSNRHAHDYTAAYRVLLEEFLTVFDRG